MNDREYATRASEAAELECAWCGGHCFTVFRNKRGENFCSKYHRDTSNRALKRFLDNDHPPTP